MQTQGYETYSNQTDDQFNIVRVEANASGTGWVSADNQADLGSLNQISYEVLGSKMRDSNGDYLHTQMPGNSYHEYSDPVELVVTIGVDANGVTKYLINDELHPELSFEFGRTYEFDLTAVQGNHPFVLSTTEGGSAYSGATLIGNKLTIDVTSSTPDLYYYCSTHYPSGNGMGNEISTVPFGMPADIEDMVGLMKSLYEAADSDSGQAGVQIDDMNALKGILENAAINGSGSVKGLSELLNNLDPNTDLDPGTGGNQSIQNIVSHEIAPGMTEFNNQTPGAAGNKTIDEIFKETIEDTIDELETHIPEAFSGS